MAHASDYLENSLLNGILRGTTYTAPSTIYIALFTSDPTDADTGAEVADSAYIRQDAAKGGTVQEGWTAPSDGVSSNAKLIQFPAIADGTVTITHYGVYDAQAGGNLLFHSELTTPRDMEVTDVVSFDIGAITVSVR